jgi:hypothetical protein
VDPGQGSRVEVGEAGPGSIKLILSRDRDFLAPTGTLGTSNLGELSASNPATYASQTIRLNVSAGGAPIPRYRVLIRVLSPLSPPPGSLAPSDVGAGVTNLVACNPLLNPLFAPDPRTAPKNGDDVPLFTGDLGDCTAGPVELYRSRCRGPLRVHSFTLVWAVGPQFFTPQGPANVEVLLTLELL